MNEDRKAVMRDKRAQGLANLGLVSRIDGERPTFHVSTPSLRGRRATYEVYRDDVGKTRCSCLEYQDHVDDAEPFRCEHILAVKHHLLGKNIVALKKAE